MRNTCDGSARQRENNAIEREWEMHAMGQQDKEKTMEFEREWEMHIWGVSKTK